MGTFISAGHVALIGHNVYPRKKKEKAKRSPKAVKCAWCGATTMRPIHITAPGFMRRQYCCLRCISEDLYIGRAYNKRGNPIDVA
jgi:hypothetical protein